MLNTRRLAKEIYALNEEMKQLESKRARSMAAQIDIKREQLQKLTKQLEREI